MTFTVPMFWVGVASTLTVELVAIIAYTIMSKTKGHNMP